MNRDQLIDTILHLSLRGETAPAIAERLMLTPDEVRKIIKQELAISPGNIGSLHRPVPKNGGKPPQWKIAQIAELHHAGRTDKEIAETVGMTLAVVRYYLRRDTDWQKPKGIRHWTFEEEKYLIEHADVPAGELARHLGRSKTAIQARYFRLRSKGIPVYKTRGRRYYGQQ